jgi:hypothetical protein
MSSSENPKQLHPPAFPPSIAMSIFVGKTAMTPCMNVERRFAGGYYIKLTLSGGPITLLYLGRGSTDPTSGAIDLASQSAIATVTAGFWDRVRVEPLPFRICVEYDPTTGAIIEIYEC